MFVRVKKIGGHEYLYHVENGREGGRHVHRVIKALGGRNEVETSGLLDGLIASAARHSRRSIVQFSFYRGELAKVRRRSIGLDLVFGHLWRGDRLPGGAAPTSGRAALRLRCRTLDLPDGAAPDDGLRLGPPCQQATDPGHHRRR